MDQVTLSKKFENGQKFFTVIKDTSGFTNNYKIGDIWSWHKSQAAALGKVHDFKNKLVAFEIINEAGYTRRISV